MNVSVFHSLSFKIGAVIVLVEIVVLAVVGFFYTDRFRAQIDRRVAERIVLPGVLMNNGLLSIDAVEDKETMEQLVGQDLVELTDGMIVGVNGNVFHALDPEKAGSQVSDLPGVSAAWFRPDVGGGFIETFSEGDQSRLASVTPLFVAEGQVPFMFAFVEVDTNKAQAAKAAITRYFALGSLLAIALTSLAIIVLFRTTIAVRLKGLLPVFRRFETGDLAARVQDASARDEIGAAQRGINAMATRLQATIGDLTDNVTALEQAQKEREALIEELEMRNAELERFTYTLSHDLKTPLVTIKGFLGLLQKDAAQGDTEGMERDIARIASAANRMARLLDELLELSRVGHSMRPPEAVDLSELAREATGRIADAIEERRVSVDIEPNMPPATGDRLRLLEVYQNLIENAVKFMGEQPEPRIEIGARQQQGKTVYHVRDNGIGIDPKYQENVFGLFNRLDQDIEGTGVGLALVRRIIELHDGRIWVESGGVEQGSTFRFTLYPFGSG